MFLVTGGAGFIGSHTVETLVSCGIAVRVLDDLSTGRLENLAGLDVDLVKGSVADEQVVARAMHGCTHVVHLAAKASVPGSCDDPIGYDQVNVRGTLVVMDAARRAGVRRLVYASSSAVYGAAPDLPKREEQAVRVESPYAAAKAADELYGQAFARTLGLECVGLRFFNVFGARQDPEGPYAAVIPKFVEAALRGDPLRIFGDGEQGRDFVAVEDVVRAVLLAATSHNGVSGRVYNVGAGRMTTVNSLARLVLTEVGGPSRVEHHPERPGDVRWSLADVSAAKRDLGWEPLADFEAAMRRTIAWYRGRLEPRAAAG